MSKQNVTSNLPALARVSEAGIPTKKLNTVQQKNYREYADRICKNVKNWLIDIRETVLSKMKLDNTDKVRKEIIKNTPEITEIVRELAALAKRAEAVTNESFKIMSDYENKKMKLDAEKESKIANLKNEKMLPIIEQYKELQEKSRESAKKNENYHNALGSDTIRIITERKYYEDDEDDSDEFSLLAKRRNVEIAYPSINYNSIAKSENSFIEEYLVEEKLNEIMKPAVEEFQIAEVKLEAMEQAVKEVMMFDEERMNEAFTKLFAFRDDIQQKHLQVVRKINFNLGESV